MDQYGKREVKGNRKGGKSRNLISLREYWQRRPPNFYLQDCGLKFEPLYTPNAEQVTVYLVLTELERDYVLQRDKMQMNFVNDNDLTITVSHTDIKY